MKHRRGITVKDILNYKPGVMAFEGKWFDSFGTPERTGCWLIWGSSGNGKTYFALQLCKYLAQFGKVAYNSLEEGLSFSFQKAVKSVGMSDVSHNFILLDKEPVGTLSDRLKKQRSPDIIIIDSLQYSGLNKDTAKTLTDSFPHKLFIFISHADGKNPAGRTAKAVKFHASVKLHVEGYMVQYPITEVFMECYRILKPNGTFWLNMGDSYAGSGRGKGDINRKGVQSKASFVGDLFTKPYKLAGYKNKDLMGMPWTLALALRDNGFYLRQDIIWHKPNPMPESIRDRCTKAHEYIFLLTKSAKYYFDHEAMLEPAKYDGRKKMTHEGSAKYASNGTGIGVQNVSKGGRVRWPNTLPVRGHVSKEGLTGLPEQHHGGNIRITPARNKRSVWSVPTKAFKGAHFATFPPALIRTCIEAGCPIDGVVMDPFIGAGTTAIVAQELGRCYVGVELNADYVRIAEERVRKAGG
ncbi:MAG: hypothetical protein FWG84_02370 [Bacteroidales bacterium]|nr:hypothetical protein [Bacteroidales bacterium]